MRQNLHLLLALFSHFSGAVVSPRSLEGSGSTDFYKEFIMRHGFVDVSSSDMGVFKTRAALFETRRAKVEVQNSREGALWTAALHSFADATDEERNRLLGYKRISGGEAKMSAHSFLAFHKSSRDFELNTNASNTDWLNLKSAHFIRHQVNCGACWAIASIGALEMHLEIATGTATELSWEQLVDCVQNQQHCGGSGGCHGATPQQAFEYVKVHGVVGAGEYVEPSVAFLGQSGTCRSPVHPNIFVASFVQPPRNRARPLLGAVAQKGPVVVSVQGLHWFEYGAGIFDGCAPDADVDHSALLVGYGVDTHHGRAFWTIRNSWGPNWGEKGHIRLLRHDRDDAHCGIDHSPEIGVGCVGGPQEVYVCGMCGILSDSYYPVDVRKSIR